MTRSLPDDPSLEHLKKQAKQLLHSHQRGEDACCETLRNHSRFRAKSASAILSSEVTLREAQHALAIDYGFRSWAEMKQHVGRGQSMRGGAKVLQGARWSPRATTHMGCLEGCASYLKANMSPAWLFGGTGHAFFMNVDSGGLSPAAPHEWPYFEVVPKLAKNVGLDVTVMNAFPWDEGDDFAARQGQIWQAVRRHIDAGLPCYGWHYEFLMICGYDEQSYLLSGPSMAPRVHPLGLRMFDSWRDFGAEAGPGSVEMALVALGRPADDLAIVKGTLGFAVRASQVNGLGKGAYDKWIQGLQNAKGEYGMGAAYNAAIYSECRRFAHGFLSEAKQRLGGAMPAAIEDAIDSYGAVSEALAGVAELFPFIDGDDEEMNRNLSDRGRRDAATRALSEARDAEQKGIEALSRVSEGLC